MGRRSLDDALTPEEKAFYKGERVSKAESKTSRAAQRKPEEEPALKSPEGRGTAIVTAPASAASEEMSFPPGLASLNTRVDPQISTALLRASMDRKLRRHARFTMRHIVEEALSAWLSANGYLTTPSL